MKIVDITNKEPAYNPDEVLKSAIGEYGKVLVVGYNNKCDSLDARASLNLTAAEILFMIKVFESKLIRGDYCDD